MRAACPGVALGNDGHAPRVTILMYADDVVILADSADHLQRALDVVGTWGTQWRFTFGIGPEKTAVMVVDSRSFDFHFSLQGNALPCVSSYTYLGVTFQTSRKWKLHVGRPLDKGNRKFHQFLGSAENRQLHTGFRNGLFRTYVLPSISMEPNFLMQYASCSWIGNSGNGGGVCWVGRLAHLA